MPRQPHPSGHIAYELGKLIQAQRRQRGLTQQDLAAVIGCARITVAVYEQGRAAPPIDMLVRIAHACDMALSQFLAPLDAIEVPLREVRVVRRRSA